MNIAEKEIWTGILFVRVMNLNVLRRKRIDRDSETVLSVERNNEHRDRMKYYWEGKTAGRGTIVDYDKTKILTLMEIVITCLITIMQENDIKLQRNSTVSRNTLRLWKYLGLGILIITVLFAYSRNNTKSHVRNKQNI